jgi:hypothetical protein
MGKLAVKRGAEIKWDIWWHCLRADDVKLKTVIQSRAVCEWTLPPVYLAQFSVYSDL